MIKPLPKIDIQFQATYSPEKNRRLVDEVNRVVAKTNELVRNASDATPTAIPVSEHILATTAGLGSEHTTNGLSLGMVLKATADNDAAFGVLNFSELGRTDPETFNHAEHGDILVFWDGFFSMRESTDVLGISDPGANALLGWVMPAGTFAWRTPGFGILITPGTIAVDIDAVTDAVIGAIETPVYPRFLLMGA